MARLRLIERAENLPHCRIRPFLQPRWAKHGPRQGWGLDLLSVVLLAAVSAWCIAAAGVL